MDKLQGESAKMIPDICSCGKGRLKKGTTDFSAKVEGEMVVSEMCLPMFAIAAVKPISQSRLQEK